MAEKSREKMLIYIIRGVFLALATLGIKSAVYFFTVVLCNEATSPFAHFPTWYINLLTFIATLFIYNSVVRFVVTYNRSIYTEFILEKREPVSKKDEALRVLSSRKEFFEMLSSFLSVLILTAAGAFFEPVAAIPVSMPIPVSRILNCVVILFCIIPIDIFARVDVRRFWYESVRMHEEDRLFKPARAILRAFVILIIYPFVFPFTPLLFFAVGTLFGAFIALLGAIGPPVFSLFVFFVTVLVCLALKIAKRKIKLHKKLKILRSLAEEQGYEVEIEFKGRGRVEKIRLSRGEEKYTAILITPWRKSRGLYFTSENEAYTLIRIGPKRHSITFQHKFEYGFSDEGKKLVILEPMPKSVYVTDGRVSRELFYGDGIWDYTVYDLASLSGFIERNILGVKRGKFE